MSWGYRLAGGATRLLLYLTRWQIIGRENIPARGPVLVIANHLSLADPPILSVSLGRRVIFMAKEQLFRFKPLGYFLRNYGAFPVRRGQLDRRALRQAEQVLADGQVLVIFPEGMRSRSHRLQQAFAGVALIALRSGAPILPVGFTGTEQINRPTWFLSRPDVKIVIGRPFHLPQLAGRVTRADLDKLTEYMMQHIAALLPLSYRGVYAAEEDEIGH